MSQEWKVRIGPAEKEPYHFKATFLAAAKNAPAPETCYLYGDGDLAVFLEDLGAGVSAIRNLLDRLDGQKTAEIGVPVTDEALKVLARRRPAARA